VAVIDSVMMNSASPTWGTPFCMAPSSQVDQASRESPIEGARWVSVQGLKLEARDRMTEEASTSIAISEEEGESEEENEGGGGWQDWRSRTMLDVVTMSSTCERVTGEGSGFRGARGTGGKPSVGVLDSTNSGDTPEDPGPAEGVKGGRGERRGGGVAEAAARGVAEAAARRTA
jgi:hypothetical protein